MEIIKTMSWGYIVCPFIENEYDEGYIIDYENPFFVPRVFDDPPKTRLSEGIKKLADQIEILKKSKIELEKTIKELQKSKEQEQLKNALIN